MCLISPTSWQVPTITYPDLTAFEEALAPVTESYCKQYGDEFTALYNQLKG